MTNENNLFEEIKDTENVNLGFTSKGGLELEEAKREVEARREELGEKSKSFLFDTLPAAFRLENEIVSLATSNAFKHINDDYDENFYPQDHLGEYEGTEYEEYLYFAKNPAHLDAIKKDIEREKIDRETARGVDGVVAMMAAGFISPFTLIPAAGVVKGAKGISITKSALKGAASVGAGIAASEAVLQETQQLRTGKESAIAIGAGTVLGGILGGAAAKLSKGDFEKLAKKLEVDVNKTPEEISELSKKAAKDAGSAAYPKVKFEDNEFLIKGKGGEAYVKATRFLNPYNRVIQGDFTSAKETLVKLANSPAMLEGHKTGKTFGTAVEVSTNAAMRKYKGISITTIKDNFKELKKVEKSLGRKPMTYKQFRERLSFALRNGDADPEGLAPITKAAQTIRSKVLEPIKNEMIDLGMLPRDVEPKFAETYLTRRWSREKLIAFAKDAKTMFRDWANNKVLNYVEGRELQKADIESASLRRIDKLEKTKDNLLKKSNFSEALKLYKGFFTESEDSLREFLKRELDSTTFEAIVEQEDLDTVLSAVDFIMNPPKKPNGLMHLARKSGGLIDDGGDLRSAGIRFGGKKSKRITLDEFGEIAYQAGYYKERPYIYEIIEDLSLEHNQGVVKFADGEEDLAAAYRFFEDNSSDTEKFLHQLDIDPATFVSDLKQFALDERKKIRALRKDIKEQSKFIKEGANRAKAVFKERIKELENIEKQKVALAKRLAKKYDNEIARTKLKAEARIARIDDELRGMRNAVGDGYSEYAEEIVESVYNQLTQVGTRGIPDYITASDIRGFMREKLIDIDDNIAEPFLENDAMTLINSFIHQSAPDMELTKMFGSVDMRSQFEELAEEYADKLATITDPKEALKLETSYNNTVRDLEALREILRGTYKRPQNPDSFMQTAATLLADVNYMAKMGGVIISSFPDIARSTMIHGMSESFGDLLSKISMDKSLKQLSKADLVEAGFGFEAVLSSRMSTLGDLFDPFARGNAITRLSGQAAAEFSNITFINHWNNAMKNWAATTTQNRVLRYVDDLMAGKQTSEQLEYLSFVGIDDKAAREIATQVKKHGYKKGKARISGMSKWDLTPDAKLAKRALVGAIRQEADNIIVTKGIADTPLMTNGALGKLGFQFKSFLLASNQRIVLRGMSDADANVLMGALMSWSLGAMVAIVKRAEYEQSKNIQGDDSYYGQKLNDWSPMKLAYEGLDRSGIIAPLLEANNMWEKGGGYGLTDLLGIQEASRYASRNNLGSVLGPSFGLGQDIYRTPQTLTKVLSGETLSESDVNAVFRNMPTRNVPAIRFGWDYMQGLVEEGITDK